MSSAKGAKHVVSEKEKRSQLDDEGGEEEEVSDWNIGISVMDFYCKLQYREGQFDIQMRAIIRE